MHDLAARLRLLLQAHNSKLLHSVLELKFYTNNFIYKLYSCFTSNQTM